MGSFKSKIKEDEEFPSIIEKKVELKEDAPSYSKTWSNSLHFIILRLQEDYQYRFCYGISGLNDPSVEIIAPDVILKEFIRKFPFEYVKEKEGIAKRERIYTDCSKLSKYIVSLNRDDAKEFFFDLQKHQSKT